MKALILGATGYVGSAIARELLLHGYHASAVARSEQAHAKLQAAGITVIDGDLNRPQELFADIADADIVVWVAMMPFETEQRVLTEIVGAMLGTAKSLIFVSGSGVVSLPAEDGQWAENSFAEDDPFPFDELPTRQVRLQTENMVREAANNGLWSAVIRPPLIWGHGGSIQIPQFFEAGRKTGAVCYLGAGLNLYSHVHVDDVAVLCRLAVEKGTPGAIYHAVAGEANFRSISEAVGEVLKMPTRSLNFSEACALWGEAWVSMGLAVNSRIRATRSRAELGWQPKHVDLIQDIRSGSYRDVYGGARSMQPAYAWKGHGWEGHSA